MGYLSQPKGGWVVPVSIDISEIDKAFFESEMQIALEQLGGKPDPQYIKASPVAAEWQGFGEHKGADLEPKAQFELLSEPIKDGPVVFMLHGGGYITGNAEMERSATFRLAGIADARVFAVDYRLAPQAPFPAALIDAVVAYKYLIEPPPGALHSAIDPSKLIIAGDSAGAFLFID